MGITKQCHPKRTDGEGQGGVITEEVRCLHTRPPSSERLGRRFVALQVSRSRGASRCHWDCREKKIDR